MGVTAGEFSSDPHRGPQKGKNFEKAICIPKLGLLKINMENNINPQEDSARILKVMTF